MTKTIKRLLTVALTIALMLSVIPVASATGFVAHLDATATVTISENGEYKAAFTPTETGQYIVESFGDADTVVYLLDSEENQIDSDDQGGTDDNFRLVFDAAANETCYLLMKEYYGNATTFQYMVTKYYEISHQPTSGEPYVELNWDIDAEYQWYKVNKVEITDKNGEAYSYDGDTASYSSENGWTPVTDSDSDYSSVVYEFEENDIVMVEFAEGCFVYAGFWDFDNYYEGAGDYEEIGKLSYTFTIDRDGTYTFYTDYPVAHRIYIVDYESNELEGETTSRIDNLEIGESYFCKTTPANGDEIASEVFTYTYAITHQPTSDEPYVELNDDTEATYQWYSAVEAKVEVTDEGAYATNYYNGSGYDAESGWSGDFWDDDGAYFFIIYLEEGDKIYLDFGEAVNDQIGIWDYYLSDGVYESDGTTDGEIELTAPWDGYFEVYAYGVNSETRVKAYIDGYEYTEIDGATDDTYAATDNGLYACEVTFADGTTEMSDVYEGPHAHDYEADVTAPTCTEQGYTTYTCSGCGNTYTGNYVDAAGHSFENGACTACGEPDPDYVSGFDVEIQTPSRTTIRCKDGIILHASIEGTLPDGAYIRWTADNKNFKYTASDDGMSLTAISANNGDTTFYAIVYNADGEIIASDSVTLTSNAGFFQKIGGFFRSLFGNTIIYES